MNLLTALALSLDAHAVCDDPGPHAPVSLQAPVTDMNFQGHPVVYTMPQDPVGVVFYFQGAGDLDHELFANEQTAMLWNLLWSEGFGVVATERTAPGGNANWDWYSSWSRNADAQRIDALRDELIATTPLRDDTPVLLTGYSDGTGFANSFSRMGIDHGWPIFAVSVHNGGYGNAPVVPTIFLLTENDIDSALNGRDRLQSQMDRAGTPYLDLTIQERIMTPDEFLREEGWDMAKAQDMFDDMVAHGLIDRAGNRLVADGHMDAELNDWKRTSSEQGVGKAVARVRIVWAMHRYNAFKAERECNWILDQLANYP